MSAMKRQILALCGCPRSGTTWLHNALIEAGRFHGVPGDDSGPASRGVFVTDENQYSHALLLRLACARSGFRRLAAKLLLGVLRGALATKFAAGGDMMLKSPYYSFFADVMYRYSFAHRFLFIRRDIDSVALSMLRHDFLSRQLAGGITQFSSMTYQGVNLETRHVPGSITAELVARYSILSTFDRALYKCLCFASGFAASSAALPPRSTFVLSYDALATDLSHRRRFCEFLGLSEAQETTVISSFRGGVTRGSELPPHDPAFRREILRADAALWNSPHSAQ